ncbi:BNR repeat-containing protein [Catenovulum agarivorans DS-2]|uniref:BNR repeat-containing protein n=2 Tax=Catenovulum agarivorans TaxID=1172192 RepID=W7QGG2_9ALTE|nr:BNR repeat-containing protein [Catenovulum agarivorans DS-2]
MLDVVQHNHYLLAAAERGYVAKLNIQENDKVTLVKTPTDAMLTAITLAKDDTLWAVGHEGVVLRSVDSGNSWQLVYQHPNGGVLFDVQFINEQHGVAIGAYGLFLRTMDGGKTWQQEFHDGLLPPEDREYLQALRAQSEEDYQFELASILPHLNRITLVEDKLFVVGELGLLAVSTDSGKSWHRLNFSYQGSLYDVTATRQGIWVSGMRGNLYYIEQQQLTKATSDPAARIKDKKINFPEPVNINTIACNQGACLLIGNSQTVWKLDNSEVIVVDKFKSKSFVSALIVDNKFAYLVGENGFQKLQYAN